MIPFNIHEYLKTRPLSWSAYNTFNDYGPKKWYDSYILGIRQSSKEMTFGNIIDKKLQDDPTFMPHVPRYSILQHRMKAKLGKIPLIGVADTYEPSIPALDDYKTGKTPWNQKRADETGQLTFYAILLYLTEGIRPEEVDFGIHWLPTQDMADPENPPESMSDMIIGLVDENDVKTFRTKRTMLQMLDFGKKINETVDKMEQYVVNL